MIDARIIGPNGKCLNVNGEGEISVTMHTHPPIHENVESYPFTTWFENSGSNDMRADGSVAPVEFLVSASVDTEIFVKTISIQISDAGANLNKFGNLTALANGVEFFYRSNETGLVSIQDEIKTNLDLIRIGASTAGIGTGTDAFKADISGGGSDTYLPFIDFSVTFGYPWGLRLRKNSKAVLGFKINDDITGLDVFNARVYGAQL